MVETIVELEEEDLGYNSFSLLKKATVLKHLLSLFYVHESLLACMYMHHRYALAQ